MLTKEMIDDYRNSSEYKKVSIDLSVLSNVMMTKPHNTQMAWQHARQHKEEKFDVTSCIDRINTKIKTSKQKKVEEVIKIDAPGQPTLF